MAKAKKVSVKGWLTLRRKRQEVTYLKTLRWRVLFDNLPKQAASGLQNFFLSHYKNSGT
jgi:hypothetical protein